MIGCDPCFVFPSVYNVYMNTQICEAISVTTIGHKLKPAYIYWRNRKYKITKIGYHHRLINGTTLFHIFSVLSDHIFFKISFDSAHLLWQLEEIYEEL